MKEFTLSQEVQVLLNIVSSEDAEIKGTTISLGDYTIEKTESPFPMLRCYVGDSMYNLRDVLPTEETAYVSALITKRLRTHKIGKEHEEREAKKQGGLTDIRRNAAKIWEI